MDENKRLYIPVNIKTKVELYDGFGTKELVCTVLSTLPIIVILWVIKLFTGRSFAFMALGSMVAFAAAAFIFVRDRTNQNVVDYVRNIIIFNGRQKHYIYNKKIEVEEREQIEIASQREKSNYRR